MVAEKRFVIIDSNSVIHRAFHALPPLATKDGELVNAIYGFLLVFFKAIKIFQPDYVAAAFDLPIPTFRQDHFKEYKAKRPKTPDGISQQIPKVKEMLLEFGVPVFEKEKFEADDIIGTLALRASEQGVETIIISGDADILQLVSSKTKAFLLRKGVKDTVLYDENLVKEKYGGLTPEQVIEFKALRGDPSDNIPGVAGIGEKTALQLMLTFGDLEKLYNNLEKMTDAAKSLKPKTKDLLAAQKDQAFLSRLLVKIRKDVPFDFDVEGCRWLADEEKLKAVLDGFGFYSLIKRLSDIAIKAE